MNPRALAAAAGALLVLAVVLPIGVRYLGAKPQIEEGAPVSPGIGDTRPADLSKVVEDTKTAVAQPDAGPAPPLSIIVPAYFFPGGDGLEDWDRLIKAAERGVQVVAITNPSSGPGGERNADYDSIVQRATRAGVKIVGYVGTNYGKRPRQEVEAEVDRWVDFYPDVKGIFFDAQAADARHVDYYVALREYARQKIDEALVVTNPGTMCAEDYFKRSASDVAIVFENPAGFKDFKLPQWASQYGARPFAAIPYSVGTAAEMKAAVQQAVIKGFGYFYVTDGNLPNPWSGLPPFWNEEVEAVKRVNAGQSL